VGAVGRYCDEKDYPNLVKAAARIAEKMPNIRFLLVGRGMDVGNSALIEMLGASGHADRFILAGERSDVADCLSAMDLFCLSSRMEAFPNVLVEAMAVGLPCVSTDVGDAAKIMGGHGVLVPKEDDARLAEGLSALLACSDAELASLGAMARAHVTLEFSIQKTLASVRGLYSEMLGREKS
jgi:glycosyltransferase involved in cell wall biosynthesis